MPIRIIQAQAIVLICLFHSQLILIPARLSLDSYWILLGIFEFVVMPAFLMTSGMSIARPATSADDFLRTRVSCYLWLYVIWSGLNLVPGAVKLIKTGADPVPFIHTSVTSLYAPSGPLWYLYYLILFTFIASVVRASKEKVLLGAFVAQLIAHALGHSGLSHFFHSMLFFFLGYYYKQELVTAFSRFNLRAFALALAVYSGINLFYVKWSMHFQEHNAGVLLVDIMSFLGITWFSQLASLISKTRASVFVAYLGSHVIPIYLLHWFVILALYKVTLIALPYLDVNVLATFTPWLFGFFSVSISVVSFWLLRRIPGLFGPPRWVVRFAKTGRGRPRNQGRGSSHAGIRRGNSEEYCRTE
jgi:hypothetical protein